MSGILGSHCGKPLEYPGDVQVKIYVSDPARTTSDTWGTMERTGRPGRVSAAGGATVVCVDFPSQKAVELPQWMRDLVA